MGPTSTTHTPCPYRTPPGRFRHFCTGSTPRSPHAADRQPPLPARGPAPGKGERAPPARARRVRAPPFPPPGPNRIALGSGPGIARRARKRLPGPRPSGPPPGRRLVFASRLTGSRRDGVHCPRLAPVPSSSRSNRSTPPARSHDDLTRTPSLRADVKARHRPLAPIIERDSAPAPGTESGL